MKRAAISLISVLALWAGCNTLADIDEPPVLCELDDDGNECTAETCNADGSTAHTNQPAGTICTLGGTKCDGNGACVECLDAAECPGMDGECVQRTCVAGKCGTQLTPAGTAIAEQTKGDCRVKVCDGSGATSNSIDDTDLPGDNNACTSDACDTGTPSNTILPLGTGCGMSGNGEPLVCNDSGQCIGCNSPSDCPGTDDDCKTRTCEAGVCGMNFTIADVPVQAQITGDCVHVVCDGNGAAVVKLLDTDVPDDGNPCTKDQCNGGVPSNSKEPINTPCAVNENDRCDGEGSCKKSNGKACAAADECLSTYCADGVCCDTACTGVCRACSAALNGSADGVCQSVLPGTDPHDDCPTDEQKTCGKTGLCNDKGACALYPLGAECAPLSCTGALQQNQDTCDGFGTCVDNGVKDCKPYACGGSECNSSCVSDGDCAAGSGCVAPICGTKKQNGDGCSDAATCLSGFCVDGVCCDSACTGTCKACSATAKGQGTSGTCGSIKKSSDPDNECASGACNGSGVCAKDNGQTCGGPSECLSGYCKDGYCCNSTCTSTCNACSAALKGQGANGTCGPIIVNTDPENECANGVCNGAGVCKVENGQACSSGSQCVSGFCADGVCCNSSCTGLCNACSSALKGQGADGTCGPIKAGTDLQNECTNGACNGSGACAKDIGQACSTIAQCLSNNCADGVCCNNSCKILCNACSAARKGQGTDGTCGPIKAGTDPKNECGNGACNGSGACAKDNGQTCGGPSECLSGYCSDEYCCDTACTKSFPSGNCYACSAALKGQGTDGTCGPIKAGTDPQNECNTGVCDGAGSCANYTGFPCGTFLGGCLNGSCCFSTCVDTSTDPKSCGSCSYACVSGWKCVNGVCTP